MNDPHRKDLDDDDIELEAEGDFEEERDERHPVTAPSPAGSNVLGRMLRRLWEVVAGPR